MIEPSAASIPWMVATGNHDTELFSSAVAADHVTVANYEPFGYGGMTKRMDLPKTGPSTCPSVYSWCWPAPPVVRPGRCPGPAPQRRADRPCPLS
jgi:hypothetical protein